MNEQFIKDVKKVAQKTPIKQELPPGAPRRYEPEIGVGKHNRRIHKESRYADTHKNLPFTFRKPQKPIGRNATVQCDSCGYIISGTTATVGMICPGCSKFSTVSEYNFDG